MKKITITDANRIMGLDGTKSTEHETVTVDYVSDDYGYCDYLIDYTPYGKVSTHDNGTINYTSQVRDALRAIEDFISEAEGASEDLGIYAMQIRDDATLREDERETLADKLEDAASELSSISSEAYDPVTAALQIALEAFEHLTIAD